MVPIMSRRVIRDCVLS